MYLLLALTVILLELIYEGLKFRGLTKISGFVEFLFLGFAYTIIIFWMTGTITTPNPIAYPNNLWKIFLAFVLLRFGIFDLLLNKVRGKPWYYTGGDKWFDNIIRWILSSTKISIGWFTFVRLCLAFGSALILAYGATDRI